MHRLLPVTVALVVASVPLVLAAGPAQARDEPPTLPAMQVVVLVDESGSLSDEDVLREREAARTIAFSVLAPNSEVAVVGFGSSDGKGQSAVDVVCEPTVLNGEQDRDSLSGCVSKLKKRTPEEGDDTDHAAALKQALSYVRRGDFKYKIVFLLTDGKLDVPDSASYAGDTPEQRNEAAQLEATRMLDALEGEQAQVWPLGFGDADQVALRGFARGQSCTPAAGDPRERVVADSSKLTQAVAEAFSSAACLKIDPIPPEDLPKGGSVELRGTIPVIASDASILVYKKDKRVQVEYRAPGADKPAPAAGGTKFEFAGQNTDVETIKISDPTPGEWRIRLSSADVAAEDVAATVVYQAAVRASVTVNPPRPVPGQEVDVEMQVVARGRTITDAAALSTLSFGASLAGDGFPAGERFTLADPDGDGTFTGKVEVPDAATGGLAFAGQVTGIGIGGDTRVYNSRIQDPGAQVQGSIRFDVNDAANHPGTEVPGSITVDNRSGAARGLRFVVADPSTGAQFTVDPPVLQAAPGETTTAFTLKVGSGTAEGVNSATLRLVDDADPTAVVAERLYSVDVTPVPSVFYRYRWILLAVGVLLLVLLALLAARLRAFNEATKVRGLAVRLYSGMGESDRFEVPAGSNSKVLRFMVQIDLSGPSLQPVSARGPDVWEVRRAGSGLRLSGPGTPSVSLAFGTRRRVGDNLGIAVFDTRTTGAILEDTVVHEDFNPFHGAPPTTPIPGPRAEPKYPPAQDPFAPAPHNPFDAPAEPSGNGFHSVPSRDNGRGDSPPAPDLPAQEWPATGRSFDPNNPF